MQSKFTITDIVLPPSRTDAVDKRNTNNTTLFLSIDKLIAALKAFDVMVCDKPGKYHVNSHRVSNPKIVAFMVYTMMLVDDSGYYTFADINSSAYLFPFEYKMEKETQFEDDRFVMNNLGGELTISLNDQV